MFVYTYSHYSHKLFFSYKKRKVETLFPSQKKKENWGKGIKASFPHTSATPPLPFTRSFIFFLRASRVDPSVFALNQLQI